MFKHLVVAVAAVGLIACGGKEQAPEAHQPEQPTQSTLDGREVVSVGEMLASSPNGQVVVDMRTEAQSFRVEKGLDLSAITVICPGSRVMNLEQWLPKLAAGLKTSPAQLREGFLMTPFRAPAGGTVTQQDIPTCSDRFGNCYPEMGPDDTWTCVCS